MPSIENEIIDPEALRRAMIQLGSFAPHEDDPDLGDVGAIFDLFFGGGLPPYEPGPVNIYRIYYHLSTGNIYGHELEMGGDIYEATDHIVEMLKEHSWVRWEDDDCPGRVRSMCTDDVVTFTVEPVQVKDA